MSNSESWRSQYPAIVGIWTNHFYFCLIYINIYWLIDRFKKCILKYGNVSSRIKQIMFVFLYDFFILKFFILWCCINSLYHPLYICHCLFYFDKESHSSCFSSYKKKYIVKLLIKIITTKCFIAVKITSSDVLYIPILKYMYMCIYLYICLSFFVCVAVCAF